MSTFVEFASPAGMLFLPPDAVVCPPLEVEPLSDYGQTALASGDVAGLP